MSIARSFLLTAIPTIRHAAKEWNALRSAPSKPRRGPCGIQDLSRLVCLSKYLSVDFQTVILRRRSSTGWLATMVVSRYLLEVAMTKGPAFIHALHYRKDNQLNDEDTSWLSKLNSALKREHSATASTGRAQYLSMKKLIQMVLLGLHSLGRKRCADALVQSIATVSEIIDAFQACGRKGIGSICAYTSGISEAFLGELASNLEARGLQISTKLKSGQTKHAHDLHREGKLLRLRISVDMSWILHVQTHLFGFPPEKDIGFDVSAHGNQAYIRLVFHQKSNQVTLMRSRWPALLALSRRALEQRNAPHPNAKQDPE
ncbi:hypothetical protein DFH11DRAFT_1542694 [Phellopilus nigrolimitatus]|nr:hypothetical protein DFH11DRAFT_1542694 [Phellopilus nigrolimitatus]